MGRIKVGRIKFENCTASKVLASANQFWSVGGGDLRPSAIRGEIPGARRQLRQVDLAAGVGVVASG